MGKGPTYAKAECAYCHIRLPKPQMVSFVEKTYTSGGNRTYYSVNKQGSSRISGYSRGARPGTEKRDGCAPAALQCILKKRRQRRSVVFKFFSELSE